MLLFALLVSRPAYAIDTDGDGLSDADEVLAFLPPNVADSDGDGKVDHLDPDMDGDGVLNVNECRVGGVSALAMVNGSFELPHYANVAANYPLEGTVPGWHTTDTNFEFWTNGFLGVPAYEGTQLVELNAFAVGTLYQDVPTTLGDVYIYAYSHRGRMGSDTMRFNLGPPSGTLTTIRTSTDGLSWGRYGGVITIANNPSRFAFQSVSSACGMSCGNLLDAISFTPVCDMDTDGDGKPDALDTDSDNDGVLDNVDACPGDDDATADLDNDSICGAFDVCPNDPLNDLDGDTVCGDVDLCPGFDDLEDMDSDLTPDACDSDRDGDGLDESVDCDEDDATVGAAKTYYWDIDNDGYGGATFLPASCSPLPGRVLISGDCDDGYSSIFPGALEIANSLDDDCDGIIDEGTTNYDDDGDGFSEVDGDCADDDVYLYPGQIEQVNGIDDDCNLLIDDGTTVYDDDNDGYTEDEGDCNDEDILYHPTAVETPDGTDEDCDLIIDENTVLYDDDNDGYTENDGDCNDADPDLGLPRTFFEDRDDDGYGWSLASTVACLSPLRFVENDDDCDDLNQMRHPGAIEYCADKADWNCDGSFGSSDLDNDHWAACEECDDMNALTHPGAAELCDGVDNNCDGLTDEGCPVEDTDVPVDTDTEEPTDLDTDVIPTNDSDECFDEDALEFTGGWSCSSRPRPVAASPFGVLGYFLLLGLRRSSGRRI